MTSEEVTLVRYRISQAKESLLEAEVLFREGMSHRSVMNRLYYAMFYAILALLQSKRLATSKHSAAIALFDREFIKTGLLPKELSKALHRAFALRQKGDYLEEAEVTRGEIEELKPLSGKFVQSVEKILFPDAR